MLRYMDSDVDQHSRDIWGFKMLHFRNDRDLGEDFVFSIVLGIMLVIVNTLLIVGVHKEKKILVSAWLVAYVFFFALSVLSLCYSFFQYIVNPYDQVGAVMSIGLILYFLLVVRSYRHNLADGHNRQQNAANVYYTENSNIKRMPLA
jgi:positive regulator of sigma E activity